MYSISLCRVETHVVLCVSGISMFGAFLLLYLASALLFAAVPLCSCSAKRTVSLLVAWTACYLCWFLTYRLSHL